MTKHKSCFALFFGNRDLFPASMIESARAELTGVLKKAGHEFIIAPESLTPYGAVKNAAEGKVYAEFLDSHRGEFDGVILCLPNFGDENGAVEALRDANVPILIQAYPDQLDQMGPDVRRDAFCGKFSVMDVFYQYGIPFTALPPHTTNPSSQTFLGQLETFDGVCRVVKGMKRFTLGAVGARTSAFKTVRFDEVTMQKYGITVESLDLSELFSRVKAFDSSGTEYKEKVSSLKNYACFENAPENAFGNLVRLAVVMDDIIAEYGMNAMAFRCWLEIEKELGISPCVLLGELNNRGITTACEMDGGTAVAMHALGLAASAPSACLDWNNNYGDDENKCILFHCGPVAADMMSQKDEVCPHVMFERVLGTGVGYGCHPGRIAPGAMTYAGAKTEDGKLIFYLGEGEFTTDKIAEDFFGCGGVVEIQELQQVLRGIGYHGFRHHVGAVHGQVKTILREAFRNYLHYPVIDF